MISYVNAARFMAGKTPSHFIFFVTARCNFTCAHCFYWKNVQKAKASDELTLEEIEKISSSLPHIKLLSLTGGEPFFRDDLAEIAEIFYRNNEVHHLVIHTNGSFGEKVSSFSERIMKTCPGISLAVSFSLDGIGEDHDRIRGKQGAYALVQEAIALLQPLRKKFSKFEVEITSVVSGCNHGKMNRVIDTLSSDRRIDSHCVEIVRGDTFFPEARAAGADEFEASVKCLRLSQRAETKKAYYPLSSFRRVIDDLTPQVELETMRKRRMIFPCTAGKRVIVLTETGELLPCELLGKSFGNVRKNGYDLKKVLFSDEARTIKAAIRNSKCFCTWGCAVSNNLIFNPQAWPRVLRKWVKNSMEREESP